MLLVAALLLYAPRLVERVAVAACDELAAVVGGGVPAERRQLRHHPQMGEGFEAHAAAAPVVGWVVAGLGPCGNRSPPELRRRDAGGILLLLLLLLKLRARRSANDESLGLL